MVQEFKEKLISYFIPSMEDMLLKEKAHLEFLSKHKRLSVSDMFKWKCECQITMLENRIKEYKEYAGLKS